MRFVEFEVLGSPAGQGSKRHVGNGVMVESSKKVKPWRGEVAAAARDVADDIGGPLNGPLRLTVGFRFPMPKSRRKADRDAGYRIKDTAPDLDKLLRAVCDGLETSGLIENDARIASVVATKAEVASWTGATVLIEEMTP